MAPQPIAAARELARLTGLTASSQVELLIRQAARREDLVPSPSGSSGAEPIAPPRRSPPSLRLTRAIPKIREMKRRRWMLAEPQTTGGAQLSPHGVGGLAALRRVCGSPTARP